MASTAFKKAANFITEIVAKLTPQKPEYPKYDVLTYPLSSSDKYRHELVVAGTANCDGKWDVYTQKIDETKSVGTIGYRDTHDHVKDASTEKAIEAAKIAFVREGDVMEHWEDFAATICRPLSRTINRNNVKPGMDLSIV